MLSSFFKLFKLRKPSTKTVAATAAGGGLTTAAMVTAAVFLLETSAVGSPMTAEFEGMVLNNYLDSVGVETWCVGETQMGYLPEGNYTEEFCMTLFNARYPQYAAQLFACYSDKMKHYVTPAMHAAFTDVYYNTGAKCKTGMMRNLKKGKPIKACDYILRYKNAGGKDCSDRTNNCYGVWDRRLKFHAKCINDAKQLVERDNNA